MLKFTSLTYQNFQSVGNAPITINLDKNPSTLVGGPNGAGKSTLMEALTYVLFGKSLKKVKLAQLINSINKKKMLCQVLFEKNGKQYRVVRGEKPKVFEIYEDNVLYNQTAAARDNQAQLEYIMGMDYKIFTQVIVLNKERYIPFMDLDATARRKVVEDILDISVFSYASEIVKTKLREIATSARNLEYAVQNRMDKNDQLSRMIQDSQSNKQDLIDQQKKIISDNLAVVESLVEEEKKLLLIVDRDLASVNDKVKALREKKNEFSGLMNTFKFKINDLEKQQKFFTDNQSCPVCSQSITDETRDQHLTEIHDKISEFTIGYEGCSEEIDNINNQETILAQEQQRIRQTQTRIQVIQSQKTQLLAQMGVAEQTINKINASAVDAKFIQELADGKDELDKLSSQYNLAKADEAKYIQMRDLLKDDGIKSHIIEEYIDFMNDKINKYLYSMDFYLNITLDSNFNDTIHNSQYDGFTYENLSTGQKCRVNIAIWLALLEIASVKNSITSNILFLDEILENIDADGVSLVMKLVKEKLSDKNVFVVSQRFDEFRDYFHSDIKFNLVDDFTMFA